MDFPLGRTFPMGQPHVFLAVIGAIHDDFRRRLAVDGVVHLVLHGGEEPLGGRGGRVVVQRGGVDVGDLLVELALGQPDFPDLFQLAFKELIRQVAAVFEAFHIHGPALDGVVLDDLVGPLAELHGALVLDLEADGDDGLQAVVLDLVVLAIGGSC